MNAGFTRRMYFTAAVSAAPKALSVLRDFAVIYKFGLGFEFAIISTVLIITQYAASILSPGYNALALKSTSAFRDNKLMQLFVLSFAFVFPVLALRIINKEVNSFDFITYFLIGLTSVSFIFSIKETSNFTFSKSKKYETAPFISDIIINVLFITYIIFFDFKVNFIIILLASNIIIGYTYKTSYYVNRKSNIYFLKKNNKREISIFLKAIFFTALMASTNILDQYILYSLSDYYVARYNLIHKYTFVISSIIIVVIMRFGGHKVSNLNIKYIKNNLIKYKIKIITYYFLLFLLIMICLRYFPRYNIIADYASSSLQILPFIILSFILINQKHNINIIHQLLIAFISIFMKYLFIYAFGVTTTIILFSHFVLNSFAVVIYVIIYEHTYFRKKRINNMRL